MALVHRNRICLHLSLHHYERMGHLNFVGLAGPANFFGGRREFVCRFLLFGFLNVDVVAILRGRRREVCSRPIPSNQRKRKRGRRGRVQPHLTITNPNIYPYQKKTTIYNPPHPRRIEQGGSKEHYFSSAYSYTKVYPIALSDDRLKDKSSLLANDAEIVYGLVGDTDILARYVTCG